MPRSPSVAPWLASAAPISPLVLTPQWAEGLTGGRGWIAIALVVFAGWRPVWLLGGAYFFGLLGTLELYAKASGASWTSVSAVRSLGGLALSCDGGRPRRNFS